MLRKKEKDYPGGINKVIRAYQYKVSSFFYIFTKITNLYIIY